jgi:hypothetical protein
MEAPAVSGSLSSILGVTVRRSFVVGRVYVVLGVIMTGAYTLLLSFVPGSAATIVPLLLPIFTAVAGMGALIVFTNDRLKGVLEYLIAYGVPARRLFANVLASSLVLVTVVLGVGVAIGAVAVGAKHPALLGTFLIAVLAYSLPMSYATAAFAGTVGMYWSALSTPREGMNSPLGLLPLVAIIPQTLVLIVALGVQASGVTSVLLVTESAVALLAVVVLVLLLSVGKLLANERLLSPA